MTYQQPQQPYFTPPPAPSRAQRAGRGPLLLAALAGFVVAAIIGGILVATDVIGASSSSSGVGGSNASVSLPKTLGSYVRFEDADRVQTAQGKRIVGERTKTSDATAKALSAAHDGAGAAVQAYTSQDLETSFSAWAVRAPTAAFIVPVVDPASLGLVAAPQEVKTVGHSPCFISNQATLRGKTPQSDSVFVGQCQRSSNSLTVTVYVGAGGDLSHSPDQVAALVDQVWDSLN